jgi:hypothetical protein
VEQSEQPWHIGRKSLSASQLHTVRFLARHNFWIARYPGEIDYFLKADFSVPIRPTSSKPVSG